MFFMLLFSFILHVLYIKLTKEILLYPRNQRIRLVRNMHML